MNETQETIDTHYAVVRIVEADKAGLGHFSAWSCAHGSRHECYSNAAGW